MSTSLSPAQIACWPGKSNLGAPPHPAFWHMLDVGAVATRLLSARSLTGDPDRDAACAVLIALHDIGKVSASFRAMLTKGTPQPARHWRLSHVHLCDVVDEVIAAHMGETRPHVRRELYDAVAGHHGGPPIAGHDEVRRQRRLIGTEAETDARDMVRALLELFPAASLSGLTGKEAKRLSWVLSGLTVLCDWIGSNQDWFPPQSSEIGASSYWCTALERADAAISAAGLFAAAPAPNAAAKILPPDRLRPMQREVGEVSLPDGPVMALIEDSTGAGKTEAALILASRMLAAGKAEGVFFALPTMATSNAMFSRLEPLAMALFDGPPSLALTHGRAHQHAGFRAIIGRDRRGEDAATCATWLAEDRRRVLLAEIGVGTIDQALMAVLPTRFSTLRLTALSRRILIVDEAHSYDPYMAAQLERLVWFQAMLGGSAIVMTATLPVETRQRLSDAFRKGLGLEPMPIADMAYPALAIVGPSVAQNAVAPVPASVRRVEVVRLTAAKAAADVIAEAAGRGAACIWVRNAVDDAIAAVEALRGRGVEADLLHARFALGDRLAHEAEQVARFGRDGQGRAGRVLVATQVAEQSLDLDFDVMVSDLAPIGSLIQRAGRLWRHMDLRPAVARTVLGPVLHILAPDPDDVADARWLHDLLDKGAYVYGAAEQWRTARALFDAGAINAPDGVRALIEAVHGPDAPDVPPALERAEIDTIGARLMDRQKALNTLADPNAGYAQPNMQKIFEDEDISTRLGQLQVTLILARDEAGALRPWCDNWTMSEVQMSAARYARLPGVDQEDEKIQAVKAGWPDWKRDRMIVAPVGSDGAICEGLSYDSRFGLIIGGH